MGDRQQTILFQRRKRNKVARDLKAFAALIASPFDLGSAAADNPLPNTFNLPGTARLGVSIDAITVQGDIVVDIGGRELNISGGVADKLFKLDVGIRAREVTVIRSATCPAGDLSLYVLDEWQRPYLIASGVFTA